MNFELPEYSESLEIINRLISTSELYEDDEDKVTRELSERASGGDSSASTLLALFYMLNSDIGKCNEWTIHSGKIGAREIWVEEQVHNPWFGYLAARLDSLESLKNEKPNLLEVSTSLQYHLFHNITDESFYYSVKSIVHILNQMGEHKAFDYFCGILKANRSKISPANERLVSTAFSSATSPYYYSKIFEEVLS